MSDISLVKNKAFASFRMESQRMPDLLAVWRVLYGGCTSAAEFAGESGRPLYLILLVKR